jgi:hypothetical protein
MKTDIANRTILSYPEFQNLPKGVKQMLLFSESYFFDQPASSAKVNRLAWCARQVSQVVRAPVQRDYAPIGAAAPLVFCSS